MKKFIISVLLALSALTFAFGFAACQSNDGDKHNSTQAKTESVAADDGENDDIQDPNLQPQPREPKRPIPKTPHARRPHIHDRSPKPRN